MYMYHGVAVEALKELTEQAVAHSHPKHEAKQKSVGLLSRTIKALSERRLSISFQPVAPQPDPCPEC